MPTYDYTQIFLGISESKFFYEKDKTILPRNVYKYEKILNKT